MSAPPAPHEFVAWLARIQEGVDASLLVLNEGGRLRWTLHAEGLPEHVGVIHVEADSADECVRLARLALTGIVAKRAKAVGDNRAQRCRFWDKKRYLDEEEAAVALAVLMRAHDPGDHIPVAAYYCDPQDAPRGCGYWHLTSHPRRKGSA